MFSRKRIEMMWYFLLDIAFGYFQICVLRGVDFLFAVKIEHSGIIAPL